MYLIYFNLVPVVWSLIIVHAIQRLLQDIQRCQCCEAVIMQALLNGLGTIQKQFFKLHSN
jgi:hypothetical protein